MSSSNLCGTSIFQEMLRKLCKREEKESDEENHRECTSLVHNYLLKFDNAKYICF
jgi:hypothetical protein